MNNTQKLLNEMFSEAESELICRLDEGKYQQIGLSRFYNKVPYIRKSSQKLAYIAEEEGESVAEWPYILTDDISAGGFGMLTVVNVYHNYDDVDKIYGCDTAWAFVLRYEDGHRDKGWAADMCRICNGGRKLDMVYKITPHVLNRYAQRCLQMRDKKLAELSDDYELAREVAIKLIVSLDFMRYTLGSEETLLKVPDGRLGYDDSIEQYVLGGVVFGFTSENERYIYLTTYVDDGRMYPEQRKRKSRLWGNLDEYPY